MPRRPQQLTFVLRTHGGARPGAGRPRVAPRPGVPHRPRAPHDPRHPVHVTLRAATLPASLRSPRVFPAVRGALARASRAAFRVIAFFVYVLQNSRKHRPAARGLDPCSSAAWFGGWRNVLRQPAAPWSPVAMARTWLARRGWRRHGLIDEREAPRRS
jgi:hypothetical protein